MKGKCVCGCDGVRGVLPGNSVQRPRPEASVSGAVCFVPVATAITLGLPQCLQPQCPCAHLHGQTVIFARPATCGKSVEGFKYSGGVRWGGRRLRLPYHRSPQTLSLKASVVLMVLHAKVSLYLHSNSTRLSVAISGIALAMVGKPSELQTQEELLQVPLYSMGQQFTTI